jgi:hypothetical protein
MPTDTKSGVLCLLEFQHMSDVTRNYIVRDKSVAMAQYESLRSALGKVMQRSGWVVHQRSFIAGARSLNEAELKENLEYSEEPTSGAPQLAQTPEDPTTGRPQPARLGAPCLLSSTLSRHGSLTKLGSGKREGVRRRKSN